mmetsp:Transcript_66133/g.110973  ORF Transcript_66133/g.110973 Transcript_66133/m.110973 type:complete len:83 (-) Transcript_66133:238-486(-)
MHTPHHHHHHPHTHTTTKEQTFSFSHTAVGDATNPAKQAVHTLRKDLLHETTAQVNQPRCVRRKFPSPSRGQPCARCRPSAI